jgi:hypothetical protein
MAAVQGDYVQWMKEMKEMEDGEELSARLACPRGVTVFQAIALSTGLLPTNDSVSRYLFPQDTGHSP